jgi:hypothetical protein
MSTPDELLGSVSPLPHPNLGTLFDRQSGAASERWSRAASDHRLGAPLTTLWAPPPTVGRAPLVGPPAATQRRWQDARPAVGGSTHKAVGGTAQTAVGGSVQPAL